MIHVNNNLWRSARPKDLNETKAQGIDTIISLESGMYELVTDSTREHQFPADFGFRYYDFNCFVAFPPEDWKVKKFLEIVAEGKPTLVHCLRGEDRTGYFCAAYRMQVQGWSFHDATREWEKLGRKIMYEMWEPALKKWEKK